MFKSEKPDQKSSIIARNYNNFYQCFKDFPFRDHIRTAVGNLLDGSYPIRVNIVDSRGLSEQFAKFYLSFTKNSHLIAVDPVLGAWLLADNEIGYLITRNQNTKSGRAIAGSILYQLAHVSPGTRVEILTPSPDENHSIHSAFFRLQQDFGRPFDTNYFNNICPSSQLILRSRRD